MDVTIEKLSRFVADQQRRFDDAVSASERKERGHFGTPEEIATFMAGLYIDVPSERVRVLDAGAGVGTLAAAVCRRLLAEGAARACDFELWENDPKLGPILDGTMGRCRKLLRAAGWNMNYAIRNGDFVLENTRRTLFSPGPEPCFDLAIMNPPYFKIRKDSPHARAMEHVVHGQPNIYALFMAVAVDLLLPGGQLIAITPRSYFNGPYFSRFRQWFFERMTVRRIHVFESRTEAFKTDAVLQENVILVADKGGVPGEVQITTSIGRDLTEIQERTVAYDEILDRRNEARVVRVPGSDVEHQAIGIIDRLPETFRSLGFAVSTGPVVTFRCSEFLRPAESATTAPLLWMHNVRPFVTRVLAKDTKPAHIEVSQATKKLLVPATTYVLLKRFTSKEERRRLVASVVTAADSYSDWIGFENHLNYVYRRDRALEPDEAFGLAAYLNSSFVDRYFRSISGNTQVNAAEIRMLPMPDEKTLRKIGSAVQRMEWSDLATIEVVVGRSLGLSPTEIRDLLEVD